MHEPRYSAHIAKRTTINLDVELTAEARAVLGTSTTTETVHRALEEVVRRQKRRSLAEWDLGGLTPSGLAELRSGRGFGEP